jgi:hypothetical protein
MKKQQQQPGSRKFAVTQQQRRRRRRTSRQASARLLPGYCYSVTLLPAFFAVKQDSGFSPAELIV